jgi:hypothetical protein
VYREYFTVTPHGFFFRGRVLPTVEHVITMFKKDPNYRCACSPLRWNLDSNSIAVV